MEDTVFFCSVFFNTLNFFSFFWLCSFFSARAHVPIDFQVPEQADNTVQNQTIHNLYR